MSCPVSERSATCHTLHLQLAGWSAERRVEAEAPSESRGTPDASLAGDDGKTIIDVDRVSPSMSQSIDSIHSFSSVASSVSSSSAVDEEEGSDKYKTCIRLHEKL